jgi:hypothetical protein
LNGQRITQTHNNNYSNFASRSLDARIDALKKQTQLTQSVNQQWAALDNDIMAQAPWAPFLNHQETDFFGSKVDLRCYENHVLYEFDYATICMKK